MTSGAKELLDKIRDFCGNYFTAKGKKKKEVMQQWISYSASVVSKVCLQLNTQILEKEPSVVWVQSPSFVFGDIHGNVQDLYEYEQQFWGSKDAKREASYVFLGDYVDRGSNSVEVALYLLALKVSQPNRFTLIRGNHEVKEVNKRYSFYKECLKKYGRKQGQEVWKSINSCFERLPLAAVIDNRVFCCHGGIPNTMPSVADISKVEKPLEDPEEDNAMANQLLWNDPIESMTTFDKIKERLLRKKRILFRTNGSRGTGYYFTALAVKQFLDKNGLQIMIRAHECVSNGFEFTSDDRVITVFSCSHYSGSHNTTACIQVTKRDVQVIVLKYHSRVRLWRTLDSYPNSNSNTR